MDQFATKAIVIGISIFVTLIIVTIVIAEFTEIKSVYKNVAETNITFENNLDELDKYRNAGNEFKGIEVNNTISKYKNDDNVEVCKETSPGAYLCDDAFGISEGDYGKIYISRLENVNNKYRIIFKEK